MITPFAHRGELIAGPSQCFLTILRLLLVAIATCATSAQTPLKLLEPPQSTTVAPGETLTLSVAAEGDGELSYQWHHNGYAIPGATTSTLTIAEANAQDQGHYTVTVTAGESELASDPVWVAVAPAELPNIMEVDSSFAPRFSYRQGTAYDGVGMADGSVIIAGSFDNVGGTPHTLAARITPEGVLDDSFNPGLAVDGIASGVAAQPDGKIIVAGAFTVHVGNRAYQGLVRFEADGQVDTDWYEQRPQLSAIRRMVVLPDGKLLVAGYAYAPLNGLIRLNPDGSIDNTFTRGWGFDGDVLDMTRQTDGSILVVGRFTTYQGFACPGVARLLPDGALDTAFQLAEALPGEPIAVFGQSDQKVVVGIRTNSEAPHLHRLTSTGAVDTSFTPGTAVPVYDPRFWQQADGKLIVAGAAYPLPPLIRLNLNGSLDTSFYPSGVTAPDQPFFLFPAGNNRLVTGGSTGGIDGPAVVRYDLSGQADATFQVNLGNGGEVVDQVMDQDGSMWVSGSFDKVNGVVRQNVAHLLSDGSLDPAVPAATTAIGLVHRMLRQDDGRMVFIGGFHTFAGQARRGIARTFADGTFDLSLVNATSATWDLQDGLLLPDGRMLVCGWSSLQGHAVWRVLANGTLDPTFDSSATFDGFNTNVAAAVESLALQADGSILVGGNFTSVNDKPFAGLARLHRDGGLDESFSGGSTAFSGVSKVAVLPDSKLALLGGTQLNTEFGTRNGYLRLTAEGEVDLNFAGTGTPTQATAFWVQPDEKWIIGGYRGHAQRLETSGVRDNTFAAVEAEYSSEGRINYFLPWHNNQLFVGGRNLRVPGEPETALVRMRPLDLSNDAFATPQAFPAGGGSISTNNVFATRETDEPQHGGLTTDRSVWFTWTAPADGRAEIESSGDSFFPKVFIYTGDDLGDLTLVGFTESSLPASFNVTAGTTYRIVATGDPGSTGGGPLTLTLTQPFVFRDGPADTTARAGETVTLSPDVEGDNLTYQWRKHGFPIAGATERNLVIPAADLHDSGLYDVTVGDGSLTITSPRGRLTVYPAAEPDLMEIDPAWVVPLSGGITVVNAVASTADGGFVIAGSFDTLGGHNTSQVARVHADGTVDTTFTSDTTIEGDIVEILELDDGKVLVGGRFEAGAMFTPLLRFNRDGSLDSTFQRFQGDVSLTRFVVDSGGIIYGAGSLLESPSGPVRHLFRFGADGRLDATFTAELPTTDASIPTLAVSWDRSIFVGHQTWIEAESRYALRLIRVLPDGTLDNEFNPDLSAFSELRDLRWGSNYTIYVTGLGGSPERARWRRYFAANGVMDGGFAGEGAPANDRIRTAVVRDGSLLIGSTRLYHTFTDGRMKNLPVWNTLNTVTDVALDFAGRPLVAAARSNDTSASEAITRLTTNFAVDPTMSLLPTHRRRAYDLWLQPDGRPVIVGDFTHVQNAWSPYIVRLQTDGSIDYTFNAPSVDGRIRNIEPQVDGKMLITGDFNWIGSTPRDGLARLNRDGTLDLTFAPPPGWTGLGDFATTAFVRALPSGQVLIGGSFGPTSVLDPDLHLLHLTATGGVVDTFVPPFASAALEIVNAWETRDGDIVVGGNHLTDHSPVLLRLSSNGVILVDYATQFDELTTIRALALGHDESLWVMDDFGLHHLNPDGSPAEGFFDVGRAESSPFHLAEADFDLLPLASGDVLVAGGRRTRIIGDPAALQPITKFGADGFEDSDFTILGLDQEVTAATARADGSLILGVSGALQRAISLRSPLPDSNGGATTVVSSIGQTVVLDAGIAGRLLTYQWFKDGVALPGETGASLTLSDIEAANVGTYQVRATNPLGVTWATPGTLLVPTDGESIYTGNHRVIASTGPDDQPDSYTVANRLSLTRATSGLSWSVLLPEGWTLTPGPSTATTSPAATSTSLAEWTWSGTTDTEINFDYTLTPPASVGSFAFAAMAAATINGESIEIMARPDPLRIRRGVLHSADVDGDRRISLSELLRVIELYNTRHGSQRTGAYRQDDFTDDGFGTDTFTAPTESIWLARHHNADTDADGRLNLSELLRVIELYNTRAGTTRTGAYRPEAGTTDGFSPGE